MPYYEELVTRTRRFPALGRIQEQQIVFDVIEGCRFQRVVQEFKDNSGEPYLNVAVDMLDGGNPRSVMFYGREACETIKRLPSDELISIAGQNEQTKTFKAWELYLGDKDPMKDKLLWAHPEIIKSIPADSSS